MLSKNHSLHQPTSTRLKNNSIRTKTQRQYVVAAAVVGTFSQLVRTTRSFSSTAINFYGYRSIHCYTNHRRHPSPISVSPMSSSSTHECLPKTWNDVKLHKSLLTPYQIISRTMPALTPSAHKGSSGRVGILGGSERYTGAPYYAAMSALRTGADLVYVFCAQEAALPIKTYSPELMVQAVYCARDFNNILQKEAPTSTEHNTIDLNMTLMEEKMVEDMAQQVISMLDRLHSLIIGPGLGRCPLVFKATSRIIQEAIHRDISLVLDADVLYMLCLEEYQDLIQQFMRRPRANTILTPNVVEYMRLIESIGRGSELATRTTLINVVLIRKGEHDFIETLTGTNNIETMVCEEKGGMKRCGGLGDILSGVLGAFGAWYNILQKKNATSDYESTTTNNLVLSCWLACCITKMATNKAFSLRKRSMTAPDVLQMICEVIDDIDSSATM